MAIGAVQCTILCSMVAATQPCAARRFGLLLQMVGPGSIRHAAPAGLAHAQGATSQGRTGRAIARNCAPLATCRGPPGHHMHWRWRKDVREIEVVVMAHEVTRVWEWCVRRRRRRRVLESVSRDRGKIWGQFALWRCQPGWCSESGARVGVGVGSESDRSGSQSRKSKLPVWRLGEKHGGHWP